TQLRTVLLGDHLQRNVAGTEPRQLDGLRQAREALLYLAFDVGERNGDVDAPLQLPQRFHGGLHAYRILANVDRWCERGDSNPQGLPRWNLNPVRLPIPPLSQPLSPNGSL